MATVYLGLGSNIEREHYLVAGLDALQALFGEMCLSPVYDSAAIGFEGQAFLNMVVSVDTQLEVGQLARKLRQIEMAHGRPVNATRNSSRRLDIDILLYDDLVGVIEGVELPRGEILDNAFVLFPLADLAGELLHPVAGERYSALRKAYPERQQIRRVPFEWRGRDLSRQ